MKKLITVITLSLFVFELSTAAVIIEADSRLNITLVSTEVMPTGFEPMSAPQVDPIEGSDPNEIFSLLMGTAVVFVGQTNNKLIDVYDDDTGEMVKYIFQVSYTPSASEEGFRVYEITAGDELGQVARRSIQYKVLINEPPVIGGCRE